MKRETDRLRVFTMLALAAALFTLFRTFPLSGDDWFREGLGASLSRKSGARRTAASSATSSLTVRAAARSCATFCARSSRLCSSRCSRAFPS